MNEDFRLPTYPKMPYRSGKGNCEFSLPKVLDVSSSPTFDERRKLSYEFKAFVFLVHADGVHLMLPKGLIVEIKITDPE